MAFRIRDNTFPAQQLPYSLVPPQPTSKSDVFNLDNKVSPSVLLIIVVLAIIFFVSGLLHMLVRLFLRPAAREQYDLDSVTAFQGQLQQLFHLHDAGLDQHFVDTLPLFQYKSIIGLENQFDCAVCLCEFEPEDKLRLLPKCSHAFHMECIDAWLLSHSTCPLCRASLIPEFSNAPRPVVHVLESGSEILVDGAERNRSAISGNPNSGQTRECGASVVNSDGRLVSVKLGKFQIIDLREANANANENAEVRRCFSMGSFEYIMEENSHLKVQLRTPGRQPILPLTPGRMPAMSERYPEARVLQAFDGFNSPETRREISKGKHNQKESVSSRRAFSFRFPIGNINGGDSAGEGAACDEENPSNNNKVSPGRTPSFARRTLHWLAGKQSRVVHSSISSGCGC